MAKRPRGWLAVVVGSVLLVSLVATMASGFLGSTLRTPWVVAVTPLAFGAVFAAVLYVQLRRVEAGTS